MSKSRSGTVLGMGNANVDPMPGGGYSSPPGREEGTDRETSDAGKGHAALHRGEAGSEGVCPAFRSGDMEMEPEAGGAWRGLLRGGDPPSTEPSMLVGLSPALVYPSSGEEAE